MATPNTQHPTHLVTKLGVGILLGSMVLLACQKEEAIPVRSISTNASDATPLVKAFIDRATRSDYAKNGATLSLDSAEWYVEAALNFSLSEAWISTDAIRLDTLRLQLTCDQDLVNADGLYTNYLTTASTLQSAWDEDTEHLILADVQINDQNGTPGLEIIAYIGSRGSAKILNTNFGTNEYYRALWELVYPNNCGCGPNSSGSGPCAAKQIQSRLNTALPPVAPGDYFTHITNNYAQGSPYMWECATNCSDVCLGPTQLSALVTSGWNVFNLMQPSGRVKVSCVIESVYSLCCPGARHDGTFTYGIKQSGSSS